MIPDPRGLVVLAGSAGGIAPIGDVLAALPAEFPLPIAVVLHRSPHLPSLLAKILQRRTRLHVCDARAGERLCAGTVYVAPAARHLMLDSGGAWATRDGKRERHVLSSANPLLESAAAVLDGGVIAVVLSGSGMDATDGVQAVKAAGGTVVVQDRESARFYGMPSAAIATGTVDHVLPLGEIAGFLVRAAAAPRFATPARSTTA